VKHTLFVKITIFTTAHFGNEWRAATGSGQSANRYLIVTLLSHDDREAVRAVEVIFNGH
jgi:hypothetical protein